MKATDFDQKFDANESDVMDELDLLNTNRPNHGLKPESIDFPEWMINSLDMEATRLGVTSQSIIKIWLAERLKRP